MMRVILGFARHFASHREVLTVLAHLRWCFEMKIKISIFTISSSLWQSSSSTINEIKSKSDLKSTQKVTFVRFTFTYVILLRINDVIEHETSLMLSFWPKKRNNQWTSAFVERPLNV